MRINTDQIKGHSNEAIGKVKETVGEVVGNKELEIKGAIQKNIGIVQSKVGDVKSAITKKQ
ncbi:CsbD family protein [Limnohabitans sp.]|jgi:uncharacterized protein YjbJ (UPF0337 family)|uniref:CsbD family protein n=1 Tax=Limnohabitans sp. TaxID=1907725 RepID=UPI0037C19B0A